MQRPAMPWLPPIKVAEHLAGSQAGRERWVPRSVALAAGALLVTAFAPYNLWWLAILCPAVLIGLWSRATAPREGALLGLAFGLGLYAAGTWWLYISIHDFGLAPVWLTLPIMAALVAIMASWQALLGYIVVRWLALRSSVGCLLLVPAAWVIVEWWRGWFLSGFPWLSLGYSQTDTWLAGFAPVGGVYLVSFALLIGAGALVHLWRARGVVRWLAVVALILPWTTGASLRNVEWTQVTGPSRTVAILQGAIPQNLKWLLEKQQDILDIYEELHRQALGADLIIWPESALPDVANLYTDYIGAAWSAARRKNSAILMGVIRQDESGDDIFFNSLLGLGLGDSEPAFYDKRHLVPFGEYFPFVPGWVRNWMRLRNLPFSDFTPGASQQTLFDLAGLKFAASICYEDAYPTMMNRETRASNVLVTVTNDGWFGHSAARYQHLQIARMRALESRRYLLRAANDGVSAVIDPHGRVVQQAPEFTEAVLRGRVTPRQGVTPYLWLGNWLAIGLAGFILGAAFLKGLKKAGAGTT
jgi:apolipoprotein N-acyltransferase